MLNWIIISLVVIILLLALNSVQNKKTRRKEKWRQFECGFNAINPPHLPFSFQFFFIALLFLIFDVEITLVLSYPMETYTTKTIIIIFSFIVILTIGLIYEWQKRKINWRNWMDIYLCKIYMLKAPTFNIAYK